MWVNVRLFLMILLIGAGLAHANPVSISNDSLSHEIASQDACCPDECPELPECDATCQSTTQCRFAPFTAGVVLVTDGVRIAEKVTFLDVEQGLLQEDVAFGLRKPPKA